MAINDKARKNINLLCYYSLPGTDRSDLASACGSWVQCLNRHSFVHGLWHKFDDKILTRDCTFLLKG